mgnify:CR=1 FL=1
MEKKGCLPLYLAVLVCGLAHTGKAFPEEMPGSPSPSAQPSAQTARVGNFKLSLAGCRLAYEGAGKTGAVDFDFPLPCQFNRNAAGEVRVVRTGKNRTLLVESSRPADPATRLSANDCATLVRGVIVTPKDIRLSAQTQKVAQCLPADWDETMFHAFAARTLPTASASGR